MSKSRVAPIKALTLPRLELMAAVTATRVAKFVQASLSPVDQPIAVHFWTDSQIVLHWLQNGTHSQSFIHQRINEIFQYFPATDWSFTPSEDNPADLLTRGISASQLNCFTLWTHGPDWLKDPSNWPKWTPASTILEVQVADEKPITTTTKQNQTHVFTVIDPSRYSHLYRLTAVIAYVYRFIHNLRRQSDLQSGPLTNIELSKARIQLIIAVQRSTYPEEFDFLRM